MPRRNRRYYQEHCHHQDCYYHQNWMYWIEIIPGLIAFGAVVAVIISFFVFDTNRKAELANAEATKNYKKITSIAVRNCDLEVVFLTERNLVDIHNTLVFEERLLGYAAEKECLEGIQFLIEEKVDINSTSGDSSHRTALHYAAEHGNLEIVRFLLQNSANPNAKEFRGKKPRDLAVIMLRHNKNNKPYREIIDLLYNAEKQYKPEQ